jgi:hypothetical protein
VAAACCLVGADWQLALHAMQCSCTTPLPLPAKHCCTATSDASYPMNHCYYPLCRAGTPLGDPIEVGALAQALGGTAPAANGTAGGTATARVLTLASVKSCYGHTEGTAGITGLLLAAAALTQRQLAPVVNLRTVNAYVAAALAGFGGGTSSATGGTGAVAFVPRQPAPGAQTVAVSGSRAGESHGGGSIGGSGSTQLAGTSSFGMSGVNAHALLSAGPATAAEHGTAPATAAAVSLRWQLQRYWPVPQQHRMLQLPRVVLPGQAVHFSAAVTATASLAYLWDHRVIGRPLLAGGVTLEMAAAAAACLAEAAVPAVLTAVTGAALVAPCLLPSATSGRPLMLDAAVRLGSGQLEVQAAIGGASLSGTSSSTTCVTARGGRIVALQPSPAARAAAASAAVAAAATNWRSLLLSSASRASTAAAAVSCARIAPPPADALAAYYQHPAATDASLHLSPLTGWLLTGQGPGRSLETRKQEAVQSAVQGAVPAAVRSTGVRAAWPPAPRIPVTTGVVTAPSTINAAGSSGGWATVKVCGCWDGLVWWVLG